MSRRLECLTDEQLTGMLHWLYMKYEKSRPNQLGVEAAIRAKHPRVVEEAERRGFTKLEAPIEPVEGFVFPWVQTSEEKGLSSRFAMLDVHALDDHTVDWSDPEDDTIGRIAWLDIEEE